MGITPQDPSLMGIIASLEARVRSLELGPSGTRPQLVACAPLTSKDGAGRVPYTSIRKDPSASWDITWRQWHIPISGLYLVQIQSKCGDMASASTLRLCTWNGVTTIELWSPASYGGNSMTGVLDLVGGEWVWVEEDNAFTPQNDVGMSNYLMLTYLGRTTP